jgi:hypothetical protein
MLSGRSFGWVVVAFGKVFLTCKGTPHIIETNPPPPPPLSPQSSSSSSSTLDELVGGGLGRADRRGWLCVAPQASRAARYGWLRTLSRAYHVPLARRGLSLRLSGLIACRTSVAGRRRKPHRLPGPATGGGGNSDRRGGRNENGTNLFPHNFLPKEQVEAWGRLLSVLY